MRGEMGDKVKASEWERGDKVKAREWMGGR